MQSFWDIHILSIFKKQQGHCDWRKWAKERVARNEVSKVGGQAHVSLVLLYKEFGFHCYMRQRILESLGERSNTCFQRTTLAIL